MARNKKELGALVISYIGTHDTFTSVEIRHDLNITPPETLKVQQVLNTLKDWKFISAINEKQFVRYYT